MKGRISAVAFGLLVGLGLGCSGAATSEREKAAPPAPPGPTPVAAGPTEPPPPPPKRESLKDRKMDFVIAPGQMAKDWKDDFDAAGKKYHGKLVELTGAAWATPLNLAPGSGTLMVIDAGDPAAVQDTVTACRFNPEDGAKYQQLEELSEGQRVRIRGVGISPFQGRGLVDCEFLEVGPSTAIPCTVKELFAAFDKSDAEARKRYMNKPLVLRAKVLAAQSETNPSGHTLKLIDPGGDEKQWILAYTWKTALNPDRVAALEAAKAGQTVIVIAISRPARYPLQLQELRFLSAPPQGVTLPDAKE